MQTAAESSNAGQSSTTAAKFTGAVLHGADFRGAKLRHADFRGANLKGARFDPVKRAGKNARQACTVVTIAAGAFDCNGADLSGAIGCSTVTPSGTLNDLGCTN